MVGNFSIGDLLGSAESGDVEAQYRLAERYYYGDCIEKNGEEAIKWYRKAAEKSCAKSLNMLGIIYFKGKLVEKNLAIAQEFFCCSAMLGYVWGQYNFGSMYEDGDGVCRDYTRAAEWYQKAADQNNASAQYRLGLLYEFGLGVERCHGRAAELYRKAVERNHFDAMHALAVLRLIGDSNVRNRDDARRLLWEASWKGHGLSILELQELASKRDVSICEFDDIAEWYLESVSGSEKVIRQFVGLILQGKAGFRDKYLQWFNGAELVELLKTRPDLINACDKSKLTGDGWADLLVARPDLMQWFDGSALKSEDWEVLLNKRKLIGCCEYIVRELGNLEHIEYERYAPELMKLSSSVEGLIKLPRVVVDHGLVSVCDGAIAESAVGDLIERLDDETKTSKSKGIILVAYFQHLKFVKMSCDEYWCCNLIEDCINEFLASSGDSDKSKSALYNRWRKDISMSLDAHIRAGAYDVDYRLFRSVNKDISEVERQLKVLGYYMLYAYPKIVEDSRGVLIRKYNVCVDVGFSDSLCRVRKCAVYLAQNAGWLPFERLTGDEMEEYEKGHKKFVRSIERNKKHREEMMNFAMSIAEEMKSRK